MGGLFFLRFICPALLQPHLHGVTDEAPSEPTSRTLTLLGKTLINLANLCEFGRKESFMAEMNHAFIRPSLQAMPPPHDPLTAPLPPLYSIRASLHPPLAAGRSLHSQRARHVRCRPSVVGGCAQAERPVPA